MSEDMDGYPILPHLGSEFMLWLWFVSDRNGNVISFGNQAEEGEEVELDDSISSIDIWVDDRIAMRPANEDRVTAVLTGDNPADAFESKAALIGGKVIEELRLGFRVETREYFATLKGASLQIQGAQLPSVVMPTGEDAFASLVAERMLLTEELDQVVSQLFSEFCRERTSSDWTETVEDIREWVNDNERMS